jgi:hypothetical protein
MPAYMSQDSSVGTVTGHVLDDYVLFLAGAGNFSLHHLVQTRSGAHPTSYPVSMGRSFAGVKATGA